VEEEEEEEEDVDEVRNDISHFLKNQPSYQTLEDILKLAEDDDEEEDPGHALFDHYPNDTDDEEEATPDLDKEVGALGRRAERHNENLQLMRKSNFLLKGKVDR